MQNQAERVPVLNRDKIIVDLLRKNTYGGSKSGSQISYSELASKIDQLLEERRRVSTDRYGLVAAEGHETEHIRLTGELNETRMKLRKLRYGTDE